VVGVRSSNCSGGQSQVPSRRKVSKHGMSTYVEKFIYSRRSHVLRGSLLLMKMLKKRGKSLNCPKVLKMLMCRFYCVLS
jgi:hypothetical protein